MKQKIIIFCGVTLGSLLIMMVWGSFSAGANKISQTDEQRYINEFCFEGKIGSEEMDSNDMIKAYTKQTNDFFNENIKALMTSNEDIPTPDLADYDKSPKLCGEENSTNKVDMMCRAISVCLSENMGSSWKNNPSPYCVGVLALGFTPQRYAQYAQQFPDFTKKIKAEKYKQLRYSYFCYKTGLELFKQDIYDGTPQGMLKKCDAGGDFSKSNKICETKKKWENETDPVKKEQYKQELASGIGNSGFFTNLGYGAVGSLGISNAAERAVQKSAQFETEIKKAKQVLDQALDAYSQLRTAWAMHVKYVDIFADLVKYRDNLVEVRKQTDTFPSKFIDATTTHCL